METKKELISIENLEDGAVVARVDQEIKKVLENILDRNTTLKAREVTMKLKIKPADEDREFFTIGADVTSKLAARRPLETRAIVGREIGGEIKAREIISGQKQIGLFDNVTPIRKESGND